MDRGERQALIERYRDGYKAVEDALAGATDAELDARPEPGAWSPREVAHHLADAEIIGVNRLQRLLAEENPLLIAYDEGEYTRRLHYDRRSLGASLATFRAARLWMADLLEHLDESEWSRAGTHSESGRYTVEDWLSIYTGHAQDHAEQIRRARRAGQ